MDYLNNPSVESYNTLEKSAKSVDSVSRGYSGGRTSIAESLKECTENLKKKDQRTWARLLTNLADFPDMQERLREISPFAESVILYVDYGCGFSNMDSLGEFGKNIHELIKNRGYKTYDCDDYAISIPLKKLEQLLEISKVEWLHCGILGIKKPRKPKEIR